MKNIFTILLTLVFSLNYSQETNIDSKIIEMMDVMGSSEKFEMIMEKMIENEKKSDERSISDEFWNHFKMEIKTNGKKELYQMLIPIYKKHLSEKEIDAIIEFYKSDAGISMRTKFPMIYQESYSIGEQWGLKLHERINNKIETSNLLKFEVNLLDCEKFKKGKFKYELPDGTLVEVVRTENSQIEYFGDETYELKMKWIDKCRYKVWEVSGTDELMGDKPLEINIFEINNNSYKFIAKLEGDDFYSIGEIEKISE